MTQEIHGTLPDQIKELCGLHKAAFLYLDVSQRSRWACRALGGMTSFSLGNVIMVSL